MFGRGPSKESEKGRRTRVFPGRPLGSLGSILCSDTQAHTHIHIHTPAHTTQFNAIVLSYELKYKFINLLYLIWSFILELIDDIL